MGPGGQVVSVAAAISRREQMSASSTRKSFAVALVSAALALACTGCFGPAPAAQYVQQAQRLHDEALASAASANSDLRDYVQLVGKRIIDAAAAVDPSRTHDPLFAGMQFHLGACGVPNVFTTGGSHIYVYSALLPLCRSEDELAAAMAHAYAHAMNLDVEHVGMRPDPGMTLRLVAWQFVTNRFTLAQEQAADRLAFDILVKAGYEPSRFAGLFQHLSDLYTEGVAPDRIPPGQRVQQAQSWAAGVSRGRRPLPVADPRTFQLLQHQAAAPASQPAASESQVFLLAFPNCLLPSDTRQQQAAQQVLRPPPPTPTKLEPS